MVDFKPGDVVQLKSDLTKKMTIERVLEDGYVLCVWIEKTKRGEGKYHTVTLKHYVNPAGIYRL